MSAAPNRSGYDVVVIGAGIVGLACAWRASLRGLSVLVVERDAPGFGASSVAAGMLAPVTEANFGEQELLRLNLAAVKRWASFAEELGAELHYRQSGALVVAVDRDDAEELRRLHDFQRSLGLDAQWLVPSECRRLEPALSPRCAGGILAPQDHQVDPVSVLAALASSGVERIDGDAVAAVDRDGVTLESGRSIAAEQVVLAAGSWSAGGIDGVPHVPVRPVKGQRLGLRRPASSPLAERIVRTLRCYLVDRGDGRVVLGGTMEDQGFDTTSTVDAVYRLLEAAYEVLPDVSELEFEEARSGLRPATPDGMPLIGRSEEAGNLIFATGHFRNGVLLTPVTADAVAALLVGEEPPLDIEPFSPQRFGVTVG